ncbi:DnaA ATPase domain-containing protein [Psittacicella gerlachiana]|uniref:Chromosomal replication initiator protein DnaA ATPAse domain-containing protein n=1 Tax=Psittacicella gerlachiana TaxID=2028574 RepID=A0A3A1YJB1_9GAMM|nr:DnaA/Hda family protein [Psittacicella gerlachiana]RIY37140.1 hypothetical protein CKF59_02000 [Psittacicella gerlachiana]
MVQIDLSSNLVEDKGFVKVIFINSNGNIIEQGIVSQEGSLGFSQDIGSYYPAALAPLIATTTYLNSSKHKEVAEKVKNISFSETKVKLFNYYMQDYAMPVDSLVKKKLKKVSVNRAINLLNSQEKKVFSPYLNGYVSFDPLSTSNFRIQRVKFNNLGENIFSEIAQVADFNHLIAENELSVAEQTRLLSFFLKRDNLSSDIVGAKETLKTVIEEQDIPLVSKLALNGIADTVLVSEDSFFNLKVKRYAGHAFARINDVLRIELGNLCKKYKVQKEETPASQVNEEVVDLFPSTALNSREIGIYSDFPEFQNHFRTKTARSSEGFIQRLNYLFKKSNLSEDSLPLIKFFTFRKETNFDNILDTLTKNVLVPEIVFPELDDSFFSFDNPIERLARNSDFFQNTPLLGNKPEEVRTYRLSGAKKNIYSIVNLEENDSSKRGRKKRAVIKVQGREVELTPQKELIFPPQLIAPKKQTQKKQESFERVTATVTPVDSGLNITVTAPHNLIITPAQQEDPEVNANASRNLVNAALGLDEIFLNESRQIITRINADEYISYGSQFYLNPFDYKSSVLFTKQNYLVQDTEEFVQATQICKGYRDKLNLDLEGEFEFKFYKPKFTAQQRKEHLGEFNKLLSTFRNKYEHDALISVSNLNAFSLIDEVAKKLLTGEDFRSQVIFLFGKPGVGKSYLMAYFYEMLVKKGFDKTMFKHYLTNFQRIYAKCVQNNTLDYLTDDIMSNSVTVIDEFSSLKRSPSTRKFIFNLMNYLKEYKNKLLVIISSEPYDSLFSSEDTVDEELNKLKTYCDECLRVDIELPDRKIREHFVLKAIATGKLRPLTPEQTNKIVVASENCDFRALNGFFNNEVGDQTFEKNLQSSFNFTQIKFHCSVNNLIDYVCKSLEISREILFKGGRETNTVILRYMVCYVLTKHTALSIEEIAELIQIRPQSVRNIIAKIDADLRNASFDNKYVDYLVRVYDYINDVIDRVLSSNKPNTKGIVQLDYPLIIPKI